jgi:hypothetical protein
MSGEERQRPTTGEGAGRAAQEKTGEKYGRGRISGQVGRLGEESRYQRKGVAGGEDKVPRSEEPMCCSPDDLAQRRSLAAGQLSERFVLVTI